MPDARLGISGDADHRVGPTYRATMYGFTQICLAGLPPVFHILRQGVLWPPGTFARGIDMCVPSWWEFCLSITTLHARY